MTPILLGGFGIGLVAFTVRAAREAIRDRDLAPMIGVWVIWGCVILTFLAANEGR